MTSSSRRYHITTFGCQMNKADSERMAGVLEDMGFQWSEDPNGADLILYNTSFFLESHELCLLAKKAAGIVMVVKIEQTPQSSLTEAIERIKNYNLNFLGFVVVE